MPENIGPRREKLGFNFGMPIWFSLFLESVFKFRKVTDTYNLEEYQSLHSVKKMNIHAGFVVSEFFLPYDPIKKKLFL